MCPQKSITCPKPVLTMKLFECVNSKVHKFVIFTRIFVSEKSIALTEDLTSQWTNKRRRNSLYKNMGLLCCVRRPNYLWLYEINITQLFILDKLAH